MADRVLKRGDSWPWVTAVLVSVETGPIDLTSADHVTFLMKQGATLITGPCEVVLPQTGDDTGRVVFDLDPTDTATVGVYQVEFEVVWDVAGDDIQTIPNEDYAEIEIVADLS